MTSPKVSCRKEWIWPIETQRSLRTSISWPAGTSSGKRSRPRSTWSFEHQERHAGALPGLLQAGDARGGLQQRRELGADQRGDLADLPPDVQQPLGRAVEQGVVALQHPFDQPDAPQVGPDRGGSGSLTRSSAQSRLVTPSGRATCWLPTRMTCLTLAGLMGFGWTTAPGANPVLLRPEDARLRRHGAATPSRRRYPTSSPVTLWNPRGSLLPRSARVPGTRVIGGLHVEVALAGVDEEVDAVGDDGEGGERLGLPFGGEVQDLHPLAARELGEVLDREDQQPAGVAGGGEELGVGIEHAIGGRTLAPGGT